jgi:hypothetical protein
MATETAEAPAVVEASAAPAAAAPLEPAKPDKKAAKAKDAKQDGKADAGKKAKKGKGDSDEASAEPDTGGPNVAAHPRARRAVARAKGWGGLVGFALGGYLSLPTNTIATAGLRALIAGVVCYVAAWAGAVFIWRRLVILELKSREQQLLSAAQARIARRALPAAPPERPGTRASQG